MRRNPVVLLAGIWDSLAVLDRMCAYLQAQGRTPYRFEYSPRNGKAGLDALARQLDCFIEDRFPHGETIDLAGFSMGGLVARYYVQRPAHAGRVERLITISSPHKGTWTAYCLGRAGVRQMRPGSDFLRGLEADSGGLRGVRFTSFWTPST